MRQTLPAPGDPNKPKARRRPHGTDTLPEGPPRRKRMPKAHKADPGDEEDGLYGAGDDGADGDELPATTTPRQGFEAGPRAATLAGQAQAILAMVSPTAALGSAMAPPTSVGRDAQVGASLTPARVAASVSMDVDAGASEP